MFTLCLGVQSPHWLSTTSRKKLAMVQEFVYRTCLTFLVLVGKQKFVGFEKSPHIALLHCTAAAYPCAHLHFRFRDILACLPPRRH